VLRVRRCTGWVLAFVALALVAGIVPAAGEPPAGGSATRRVSLAVLVCIGDTSDANCGPSRPKLRLTAGVKTLTGASIPELAKRAGMVTVLRMPSATKAFSCPGACNTLLPGGTGVQLTAKATQEPNRAYKVIEIDGCKANSRHTCQFTLGRQTKVTVVFAPDYGP
jgi:hypothetical protein